MKLLVKNIKTIALILTIAIISAMFFYYFQETEQIKPAQAQGTTYYVDNTVGANCDTDPHTGYNEITQNCDGGGVNATVYQTIQGVIDDGLNPGDTIYVRSGTYDQVNFSSVAGAEGNEITLKGYPGDTTPVLDKYFGGDSVADSQGVIYFGPPYSPPASYITVEDLRITNSDPMVDTLNGYDLDNDNDLADFEYDYCRWKKDATHEDCIGYSAPDNITYNNLGRIAAVRINSSGTPGNDMHHLTFRNIEMFHIQGSGFSGGSIWYRCVDSICTNGWNEGNSCSTSDDCAGSTLHHVSIINCKEVNYPSYKPIGYCMYLSGDNNLYQGNYCEGAAYGIHGIGLNDSIVEYNLMLNVGTQVRYHSTSGRQYGGGGIQFYGMNGHNSTGNIFRYNVVQGNSIYSADKNHAGIGVDYSSHANNEFYGNTVYGTSGGIYVGGISNIVKNNIVYNTRTDYSLGTAVASNNLGNETNPLFVNNGAYNYFALTSDSPAKDTGVTLADEHRFGLKNTSWPTTWTESVNTQDQNTALPWDIGAYVYRLPQQACSALDLICDEAINTADLLEFVGLWGQTGSADLNQDNITDTSDLGIMMSQWSE